MKSDCSAESWLNFFKSAGIPDDSSRTYAVTFSKNEIQLDMLSEIKKEYLVDMGITLMGHIIAILRHAKAVYNENVTKKTLSSTSSGEKLGLNGPKTVAKEKPVVKTVPLGRISANDKENPTISSTVITNKLNSNMEKSRQLAVATSTVTTKIGPSTTSTTTLSKRKEPQIVKQEKTKVPIASKALSNKKKCLVEVVNQHADVSISSSTSSSSSSSQASHTGKGRVFERLGEEVTSSPSSNSPESSSGSGESVFFRLGGKTSPTYGPECPPSPVKISYRNVATDIIKSNTTPDINKVQRVIQNGGSNKSTKPIMCTMRADEELQTRQSRKRARSPETTSNIDRKKFIGPKEFETLRSNIKSRLGKLSRSGSPFRNINTTSMNIDKSIGLNIGEFRSDKILSSRLGSNQIKDRNADFGKDSVFANPTSPIGLSGLTNNNNNKSIKSRLGKASSIIKPSSGQKKVSFGPVSQQLIPVEKNDTFPTNRQFRLGKFRGTVGFNSINYSSRIYDRY